MALGEVLSVTLEAVTPLFLGGADARGEPELRSPAFRGALRYWLRAALGGALGGDLEAVRRAEAAVFGSPDEKLGGASGITIRVRPHGQPESEEYRRAGSVGQPAGRDYLYWSMIGMGGGPGKRSYPPDTPFTLTLTTRPGGRAAQPALPQAAAALWLLVQLGGVGSRARRTAGSLTASGSTQPFGMQFGLSGDTAAAVAAQLAAGLQRVRTIFTPVGGSVPALPARPEFDVLSPGVCSIWVLGTWDRASTAVDALGAGLRDFRVTQKTGTQTVPPLVDRAIFGLPLWGLSIQAERGERAIERRASPLWLKVSKMSGGGVAAVATLFRSRFLPPDVRLGRGDRFSPPPSDYALIERWVAESFPSARRVDYA